LPAELRQQAYSALWLTDPSDKCATVRDLQVYRTQGRLTLATATRYPALLVPGAPHRPQLVEPHLVPRRKLGSAAGRAALLHSIAHIEFNAINLALDAVTRFPNLPPEYYFDWLGVAAEEAYHFTLLTDHLTELGYAYGDFTAHNGLWEIALRTADDPLARMGLVPRILEARGLDVTPAIQVRLRQADADQAADLLDIILRDEVGHVRIGNHWYHYLCAARGCEPVGEFQRLLQHYGVPAPHPPFNIPARLDAGFTETEMLDWS
jgi:uncharacterized ferritin-like protein (DUF455 family)